MELTVITGLSGAGKSQAMGAFEDAGFFCVDNLPPRLLPALAELVVHEGTPMERVAVVCDARGGVWFEELARELDRLREISGVRTRILFLEAADEALVNRFRETRRRHPLALGGSVLEGVERERGLLADIRTQADLVIDTSGLNIWDLRRAVAAFITPGSRSRMRVSVLSFGFKFGAPREADLLLDVRFLRNPHYLPQLKPLTGRDPEILQFLREDPRWEPFVERLTALLDLLLPAYAEEGKQHLVIAIGCTGGRHRSVALAELVAQRYSGAEFAVSAEHRDAARDAGGAPVEAT